MRTFSYLSVRLSLCIAILLPCFAFHNLARGQSKPGEWQVGAAKADITPKGEVRLSGYGNRAKSTATVDDPLCVRAMAMKHGDQRPMVIVSLDAIGLSATLTDRICAQLLEKHSIERSHLVLCSTHSHTAPHLEDALPNLFSTPLDQAETSQMMDYSQHLVDGVIQVVDEALKRLSPASVSYGTGKANFAINRRLLKNNIWSGFGTVDDGPVDRTVRVIHAQRHDGSTIAIVYQYACHCTSISPELNRISGDWAGISSTFIESQLKQNVSPDAVALPIIGCGADANPNPRGTYEHAQAHGKEMAESVLSLAKQSLKELPAPTSQSFQLIAIASERPSRERLETLSKSTTYVERNFAAMMLKILEHKDRLPETYPAPVHFWNFGDSLAWIFMGGEVVVDYQMRLEKELSQFPNVWVAGYVDDVFAYIASERVRGEGGYEVDGSMLYYAQPGRWVTGTEELLVGRILDMAKRKRPLEQPLSATDSLKSIEMPKGWTIELMASEPLVEDPVNIAFGADGALWVVEMGDYPSGGSKKGRIKKLTDTDGDGKPDKSTIFLDDLSFPAGAYPWRNGLVVACAPDVFIAFDRDNNGIADDRQVLLTGFPLANPQHRVNGFTYGLDHRLHLGVGADVHEITEVATGRKIHGSGSDLSLDVDSGTAELESGATQYIRGCDGWGNWFGNDNSHPLFHYVWNREWQSQARVPIRTTTQHAMQPATAPPVFPISRELDRFNDLFAANRFTSACSSIICRSPGATPEMQGCALVCESVHNLVSRIRLEADGATFHGTRFPEDREGEWLRSSDPWFRPVRVENGLDGTIWIVDMYRRVIEHPEWIPDDWQRRLNLRAGDDMGRIYRAYLSDFSPKPTTNWKEATVPSLLVALESDHGASADIAMQQLLERFQRSESSATNIVANLKRIATESQLAQGRLRAWATLIALNQMKEDDWIAACNDEDARVVRWIVASLTHQKLVEGKLRTAVQRVCHLPKAKQSASLALELIAALSLAKQPAMDEVGELLVAHAGDKWIEQTMALIPKSGVDQVVKYLLAHSDTKTATMTNRLIVEASPTLQMRLKNRIVDGKEPRLAWHYSLGRHFMMQENPALQLNEAATKQLFATALEDLQNPDCDLSTRREALEFIGSRIVGTDRETVSLFAKLLAKEQSSELGQSLMRHLVDLGPLALEQVFLSWSDFQPSVQTSLVSNSRQLEANSEYLLDKVLAGTIPLSLFQVAHIEQLRKSSNQELKSKVDKVFGPPPGLDRQAIAHDYLQQWPASVDIVRGEAMYKQHCSQCHQDRVDERGELLPAVGPNIQSLSGWKNEAWLTAILDPNRVVESKYQRMLILTENGKTIVGLRVRDGDKSIELVNDLGQLLQIEKSEIEELRTSDKSLMPEGFEKVLNPADVASVIAYLRKAR